MTRRNDQRARARHPAYWAFLMHRLSGLALAVFLPLHFWALGQALPATPPRRLSSLHRPAAVQARRMGPGGAARAAHGGRRALAADRVRRACRAAQELDRRRGRLRCRRRHGVRAVALAAEPGSRCTESHGDKDPCNTTFRRTHPSRRHWRSPSSRLAGPAASPPRADRRAWPTQAGDAWSCRSRPAARPT